MGIASHRSSHEAYVRSFITETVSNNSLNLFSDFGLSRGVPGKSESAKDDTPNHGLVANYEKLKLISSFKSMAVG
jgi:hypothetical protein